MGKIAKRRMPLFAAAPLYGLFVLTSALAAPPPGRQSQILAQHLDLSAPVHSIESSNDAPSFPSPSHRQTVELSGAMHTQPSVEERLRLLHQEGFPVARLWENKTAVLHLGFNRKGKPGLWIMRKTH
jgi:hypothetical protein